MDAHHHVLILGGTGRSGGRVLTQLLDRGVPVRAIVRPGARLPGSAAGNPLLDVVQADLLALPPEVMARHLDDCDTVISCLGHSHTGRGTFGPPLDLVEQAVRNVWAAVITAQPTAPVRVILMTGASVNQPGHADTRRGRGERAFLGGLRTVMPPARDNQRAADVLAKDVGASDPHLEWVIVRPNTLTECDLAEYWVHDEPQSLLSTPDHTRMADVAHFMCELVTNDEAWQRWRGRMPLIVDARPAE